MTRFLKKILRPLLPFFGGKKVLKDMGTTSVFSVLGRMLGLVIPFLIAAWYPTGPGTDAFFLAYWLILWGQIVVTNILENGVVPFIHEQEAHGINLERSVSNLMIGITKFLVAACLVITAGVFIFFNFCTSLQKEAVILAFCLFLEMLPTLFFTTWISILNGGLNARKHFHVAAVSPMIRSIFVIASALMFRRTLGMHAVALGYLSGELLRLLLTFCYSHNYISPIKLEYDSSIRITPFFKRLALQTAAFAVLCSLGFINQAIATYAGPGELTLYTIGERLRNVPQILMLSSVIAVVYSHWSHEYSGLKKGFRWADEIKLMLGLITVTAVAVAIMVYYRSPLAHLAVGRGEFPEEKISVVAHLFAWLAAGLVFDVPALLAIRLFMIYHKDRAYLFSALARITVTTAGNIIF